MDSYSLKNLTFSYPQNDDKVLNDITFSINKGQFIVLCGSSGCGKTTLLRHLKPVLSPHGDLSGEILFDGISINNLGQREQSTKIGFVMQSPDNQIVTDKVWHELSFGLESLGFDTKSIRLKVTEMASFFGIENWFYKNVAELSGGQKQLLNLAAIMTMQPSVLILDEPTSQLDPIAATEFLSIVGRINRELGITVIITEHRLEEVFPLADRVLVLDNGKLICDGTATEVGMQLKKQRHGMFLAMPTPMRIYAEVDNDLKCPITVREGRLWLDNLVEKISLKAIPQYDINFEAKRTDVAVELDEVWFRYEKEGTDIIKGLSLKIKFGEFFSILGGNGTGKSTTLSIISGINKPYRGIVKVGGSELSRVNDMYLYNGLLGVLPQNPQSIFVKKTLKEDLYEMISDKKISSKEKDNKVNQISILCKLTNMLEKHPYDLSGGEQQRAALAKVLLLEPKILLLDEPTKGLDAEFKIEFADILYSLIRKNVAIVMVSHDIEFCALYSHRCALFFDGNIVTNDAPREFFSGNSFYTTAANRMARQHIPNAVIPEDIIIACGGKAELTKIDEPSFGDIELSTYVQSKYNVTEPIIQKKTLKYKMSLSVLALLFFVAGGFILRNNIVFSETKSIDSFITNALIKSNGWNYFLSILFIASGSLIVFKTFFNNQIKETPKNIQTLKQDRNLSKRTIASMFTILLTIPLTIYIGIYYLGDRKYYFISILVILQTILPFILVFESRNPQARELIVIAVLCAIGVTGRAAFFMLPQFKPVMAIVIIAGVAFGAEAGFLVGAVTAFVSNMFFGQGPWTPWQMFAFGIIGFLAGVLFKKGFLRRNLIALCMFGGICTFFIYGGIMNPAAVLMFQSNPTKEMFFLAYLRGIPFDLVHSVATVTFLFFIAIPMLEKLDRIKLKYGLIEVSK